MTERLYYDDSLLLEFGAKVEEITTLENGCLVRLNRTSFYPTSGGQLFDTGTISGCNVIEVTEAKGVIHHHLNCQPPFKTGDDINGCVDISRRRANMQKHTGQHILSQALILECQAETVSAHLGEEDSTIDLKLPELSDEQIARAEDRANLVIFENRPVEIIYCSADKLGDYSLRKIPTKTKDRYRLIVIKEFDWSACGGTHCAATGGVGVIKITGQEKIRGNLRLHFLTGLEALEDYRWRHTHVETIARKFSCHSKEIIDNIENLMAQNAVARKTITELRKKLLPSMIDQWLGEASEIAGHKIVSIDYTGNDFGEAREAALSIIDREEIIVLIGCDDKILIAVSNNVFPSASELMKRVMEKFGGRGGGSDQLAQGGCCSPTDIKILIADPKWIFDI